MLIDFDQLTPAQAYFALIQSVIPRPIAWALTDNGDGSHNLAPFSFFNAVCGEPPIVMISVGHKPDGTRKDTWVNIAERGHFVVHIVSREQGKVMVATAATLPHGESEVSLAALTTTPVAGWPLPRIEGPRIAMWCERFAIHEIGAEPQGLILGRVRGLFADDEVATTRDGRLLIDAAKVDPLSRLGGNEYATFGAVETIVRPK